MSQPTNGGARGAQRPGRVLIVTDVRLYRDGVAAALSTHPTLGVRATAASSAHTLAVTREEAPDLVLLDATIPGALDVARTIRSLPGPPKVLVLAVGEEEDELLPFIEAGAAGYVAREGSLDDLIAAVGSVQRGEMLCSPRVAATLGRRLASRVAADAPSTRVTMTAREAQVLQLLERGLSNKEIAAALSIGVATVKNHIHSILDKLHVHRRGEAAARSRAGYLQAPVARRVAVMPPGDGVASKRG